jgi:hypothetical protein
VISFKKIHFLAPSNLVNLFYNQFTGEKKNTHTKLHWHLRKVVIVETPIKCCSCCCDTYFGRSFLHVLEMPVSKKEAGVLSINQLI